MPNVKQTTFKAAPAFDKYFRSEHGGALNQGRRKEFRPLASSTPIHVVLRSTRAKGEWSFLHVKNRAKVEKLIQGTAKRFAVRTQKSANSGNHLHLIVYAKKREHLQAFFRTLPALLARMITGAKKGVAKGKFWDAPLYTRIVSWGRELIALKRYLLRNNLEAVGFLNHDERTLSFREALAHRGLILVV